MFIVIKKVKKKKKMSKIATEKRKDLLLRGFFSSLRRQFLPYPLLGGWKEGII